MAKKSTDGKVYDTDIFYKVSEWLSYRIFGPLFVKLPFSHIQITVVNFFTNGLASVYFFTLGTHWGYLLGIFLCFTYSILDWMDGYVAKSRSIQSVLGGWLDPALDFVWQHFLITGLVLGVYNSTGRDYRWLLIGLGALMGLVVANYIGDIFRDKFDFKFRSSLTDFRQEIISNKKTDWLDRLGMEILAPTNFVSVFFVTIRYSLVVGALINRMDLMLLLIFFSQTVRGVTLFYIYSLYLERLDKKQSVSKHVIIRALEPREVKN